MAQDNIVNGFDFGALPINITYCGKIIEGKNGWDHFLYSVNIGTGKDMFTTQYKCGLGHTEFDSIAAKINPPPMNCKKYSHRYLYWLSTVQKPVKPSNSDIMYSLLLDSEASDYSFSEWCDSFGFDSDSISAFNTYQQCENIGKQLKKVFSNDQLSQMIIALEDY